MQAGATKNVLDAFMDTSTPIKQLEKAAKAPIGNEVSCNFVNQFHATGLVL